MINHFTFRMILVSGRKSFYDSRAIDRQYRYGSVHCQPALLRTAVIQPEPRHPASANQ